MTIQIVLFSRSSEPQLDSDEIVRALSQLRFIVYSSILLAVTVLLVVLDNMRVRKKSRRTYGDVWVFIRVALTANFSCITVLAIKAVSSLLSMGLVAVLSSWMVYVLLVVIAVNAVLAL